MSFSLDRLSFLIIFIGENNCLQTFFQKYFQKMLWFAFQAWLIVVKLCRFDKIFGSPHSEIYSSNRCCFINVSIRHVTYPELFRVLNGEENIKTNNGFFSNLNNLNGDSNSVINFCISWAYFLVSEGISFFKYRKCEVLFGNRYLLQIYLFVFKSFNFIKHMYKLAFSL